ncbi:hypothetical protein AURANDRAFT_33063, partial [Aureococcus anophagefferens]
FAQNGMLSPTGRCHTFDISGDGYARGESCIAMFLATKSRDAPDPSILATAVQCDGPSASLTAPNGQAQR